MKNKLIATLVASTLQLYSAHSAAQVGSCDVVGNSTSANAATPVSTGPLDPVTGFPEYVTDSNGVSLQRCLDAGVCFFDPIVESDPFSLQIGSGGEAFYWNATAQVVVPGGKRILTLVMAAETAFLQGGPNGEPINGSQVAFLRLRFTMDVPVAGTYTVKYPYGTEVFTVTTARANRDITMTVDRGFAPNSTVLGSVGPFLRELAPPNGYLGSGVEPGFEVTGSPCGRNHIEITGVDEFGNPVDWGGGITMVSSNLFTLQGKIYDGVVQTPLSPTRLTYSREAGGRGQIETFANSTTSATVTVKDGPTIPAASSRIPNARVMDHLDNRDSLQVTVADAALLPPILSMKSTDTGTDPTTLNLPLVDFVDISRAEFDQESGQLTVSASSGDRLGAPKLTLRDFADFEPGNPVIQIFTRTPPATVHVDSAGGGTATAQVKVRISSIPPSAPTGLAVTGEAQHAIALRWNDISDTEDGFRVIASTAGQPDVTVTVPPNTETAIVTGLAAETTYTLRVAAFNHNGSDSAGSIVARTLAPPPAPTAVLAALADTPRIVRVTWTAADGATGYEVYRTVNGVSTLLTTDAALPASTLEFQDTGAPVGSTVVYQVVTLRERIGLVEASSPATSLALTTPSLPTAASALSVTLRNEAGVVTWSAAGGATSQQVQRQKDGGAFVTVSAALGGSTTSFSDPDLPGGQYVYRIHASNWAGTATSTVSATLNVVKLAVATSVSASTANQPVLNWTDNSIGESGYQIRRRAYTVNAATGATTAGDWTTLTAAPAVNGTGGRGAYTDASAVAATTYRYEVTPLNGTNIGTEAFSGYTLAQTGGLPRMSGFSTVTASVVNGLGQVALTWPASTNRSVGGYEITRCNAVVLPVVGATAACANAPTKLGNAVLTGGTVDGRNTVTFTDTTVARNTAYVYNIRLVGGAGTGLGGQQLVLGKIASVR